MLRRGLEREREVEGMMRKKLSRYLTTLWMILQYLIATIATAVKSDCDNRPSGPCGAPRGETLFAPRPLLLLCCTDHGKQRRKTKKIRGEGAHLHHSL